MPTEVIDLLLRVNLALAASVIIVLALRVPARRLFGARVAYALWLLPLVAMAMCFVPGRVEHIVLDAPIPGEAAHASGIIEAPAPEHPYLLWAWCLGVALSLIILTLRQARFTLALGKLSARGDLGARVLAAESTAHGPAVIGVLRPVIVTPSDFDLRFDAEERRIVLAHERAHLAQGDPWINALAVLLQCVNWFNPFVHIGARALRLDQELACDAAVLAQSDGMRRRYAEAMLKTHVGAVAPLGCAWPPSNLHALKERISMLKLALPTRAQRLAGASIIVLAAAGAAAASWAAQPTRVVATMAPFAAAAAAYADDDLMGEFDDNGDGRVRIMRDGVLVEERDLTPEEREELRRSLAEARESIREARESIEDARLERLESLRELENLRGLEGLAALEGLASLESLAALEALADIDVDVDADEDSRRAIADARRQAADQRREIAEQRRLTAEERREIQEEVREAMQEARLEMARASREEQQMARDAIREARREIAEELREARARGDRIEIEALEVAEESLRRSEDSVDKR